MKLTKICPYCKKTFTTEKNARKYCKKRCADMACKLKHENEKSHLCQWCGHIFTATRKRKFCSKLCHKSYMRKLGLLTKTTVKIPVKVTLSQATQGSKAEKVSYGTYVSLHRLS